MEEKTDLTIYGDQELSLQVFNDEGLYLQRHTPGFIDYLREIFIFTEEQEQDLIEDLEEEANEE